MVDFTTQRTMLFGSKMGPWSGGKTGGRTLMMTHRPFMLGNQQQHVSKWVPAFEVVVANDCAYSMTTEFGAWMVLFIVMADLQSRITAHRTAENTGAQADGITPLSQLSQSVGQKLGTTTV